MPESCRPNALPLGTGPTTIRARLVVLTGASGSGKTTLARELVRRGGGTGWITLHGLRVPVLDADDFIGLSTTAGERHDGLRRLLQLVATMGRLCFCVGQIPPDDLSIVTDGLPDVTWLWLTVSEDTRRTRLASAGWSADHIAHHRAWLDNGGFDAACEAVAVRRFDGTDLPPERLAEQVIAWLDENFGGTMPDYKAWAAEAPACNTLEELAGMVGRNPQLDYADLYHPLPFPAFDRLRTAVDRTQFDAKVEQIRAVVARLAPTVDGRAPPRVVDVGANGGAVSIPLAQAGYEVTAVEPDTSFVELGRRACELAGVPVEWVKGGLDKSLLPGRRFDVALVLSVFQWVAEGGKALEEAGRSLRALTDRCHSLVFELGFNAGSSCLRTDDPDHAAVLLRILLDTTGYSDFELLGGSELYPGQTRLIYCCKGRRGR